MAADHFCGVYVMAIQFGANEYLGKLRWRNAGDPEEMICTLGFQASTDEPNNAEHLGDCAEHLAVCWATAFPSAQQGAGWTFVGSEVIMGPSTQPTGVAQHVLNVQPAGGAGRTLPTNCAVLVSKMTGVGGKRGRGRMFLPAAYLFEGSDQSDSNGVIAAGRYNTLQNCLNAFMLALAAPGPGGFNLHPHLFHDVLPAPMVATPITSLRLATRIATQRRRMR